MTLNLFVPAVFTIAGAVFAVCIIVAAWAARPRKDNE